MKLPSDTSVLTPYLPIVNAIAPNAPIGATFMMKPTILKKMWLVRSIRRRTGSPRSPSICSPKANRMAKNSTCRISPVAKAPTTVDGHADARLPEIDDDQADNEGERCYDLEVEQRLEANAADLSHILHAGDAVHDGEEDDRRDDHLDHLDEAVAERLHGLAK